MRITFALAALLATGFIAGCQAPPTIATATPTPAPSVRTLPAPTPCAEDPGWSDPTTPRHVFGNTWFVGTCSISAILITSNDGHVLIDAATEQAAPAIEANIRALGFKVEDIRVILNTHEHNDHAGGIALLQRDSGARVLARVDAARALANGKAGHNDPQFGVSEAFPPVANVQVVADGEVAAVGSLRIANLPSPGHTLGGSGWSWRSCEAAQCRDIVFADSATALSDKTFRYDAHPAFVAAFRVGLDALARLPCDILITTHVQTSDLLDRLDGKLALVDPGACRAYAANAGTNLDTRLAKEAAGELP